MSLNIIKTAEEIPETGFSVLKFGAVWCGPCKRLNPIFEKLPTEFTNVSFFSVDVDDSSDLSQKFSVKSVPTVILLHNGVESKRIVGLQPIDVFRKIIRDAITINSDDINK